MSRAKLLLLLLPALAACDYDGCCDDYYVSGPYPLVGSEADFLAEDVLDMMAIAFQASENSFLGDSVLPGEVLDPPTPANGYTVNYALPPAFRGGLGYGDGDVLYNVTEDGVPNPAPLTFSFATTLAQTVEITYDLVYYGDTVNGRATDVAFVVTLTAWRAGAGWETDYQINGDCYLGATHCTLSTLIGAFGPPANGVLGNYGGGNGTIDDPDVLAVYDYDLDYGDTIFWSTGPVGPTAFFDASYYYTELY